MSSFSRTSVLFGESTLSSRRKYQYQNLGSNESDDDEHSFSSVSAPTERPAKGTLTDFVFGFLYEEDTEDDDILYRSSIVDPSTHLWNPLHASLCLVQGLTSAATAVPVSIVPTLRLENVSQVTAAAVLGSSLGKFVNGPICDMAGARRSAVLYALLLALTLLYLSVVSVNSNTASRSCFLVEFAASIQWPCTIVTLATHHRGNTSGLYEGGVFVTSLSSRLGSLIAIPLASFLLRRGLSWRLLALLGAWISLISASVSYLHVTDAPHEVHQPQNPIHIVSIKATEAQEDDGLQFSQDKLSHAKVLLRYYSRIATTVLRANIIPSLRHILLNPTFWLISLAHTGSCMVRTSERALGTYLWQTSGYHLHESKAAGLAVFLSIGTVAGLILAGNVFASQTERQRKWLIWRLYVASIGACYILATFGLNWVQSRLAPDLMTIFQVMAIVVAGFGVAVQYYHIPSLVGASFGVDKGMFCAYVDGVALAVASWVWGSCIGGTSNDNNNDNEVMQPIHNEWAYSWATVALILIVSSIVMVEFMEHYFCRAARVKSGTYETIILA